MTGDEKNMATFVDGAGGLWTVTPNHVLAGWLDVTAHTDEGPHTLTIPTADAVALAAKAFTTAAVLLRAGAALPPVDDGT